MLQVERSKDLASLRPSRPAVWRMMEKIVDVQPGLNIIKKLLETFSG